MGQDETGRRSRMIAVDKKGGKVLFVDPASGRTETVIEGLPRTVHELLVHHESGRAFVPIFGDGVHGNNPNPGHLIAIIDLESRRHVGDVDLGPLAAPHTARFGPDGHIYITCEDSGVVAIVDHARNEVVGTIGTGSTNCHRLDISPDGRRLYTENEEDRSVSVIDLPSRELIGQIETPHALGGIAVSGDGRTVIAVDDEEPALYLIDAEDMKIVRTVTIEGASAPGQIARFSPGFRELVVTGMKGDWSCILDADLGAQSLIPVGVQPMDVAFRGNEMFVACQGDGSIHVVDIAARSAVRSFSAGTGCETLDFF